MSSFLYACNTACGEVSTFLHIQVHVPDGTANTIEKAIISYLNE